MILDRIPKQERLEKCPSCGAEPGEVHADGCDVEICSACGKQRLRCLCGGRHDKAFARWTGIWPGEAESRLLGMDLNEVSVQYGHIFFVKPGSGKSRKGADLFVSEGLRRGGS